jgi:Mrp family chromosome partitioning ATPase
MMLNRHTADFPVVNGTHGPSMNAASVRPFQSNPHSERTVEQAQHPSSPVLDLSSVPTLTRRKPLDREDSVFESDPEGVAAVQFRLMQRRLVNVYEQGGLLLLTSPGMGDGKSLTAHNLAWALAEAGHETLLLELDLRRPSQTRRLGASPHISICDVLAGRATPKDALRKLDGLPLGFIGLDRPAQDPVSLLRSSAMPHLLSWAKNNFSWVVIDAPPILPVADVEELLPSVDLVALVVRERVTPNRLVQRAVERLGDRLGFTILNDTRLSESDGYRYG